MSEYPEKIRLTQLMKIRDNVVHGRVAALRLRASELGELVERIYEGLITFCLSKKSRYARK